MTIVANFFSEIGFSESICTGFAWLNHTLELSFEKGIDIGGSMHPLAESFEFESPCKIYFTEVSESILRISKFIGHPNIFKDSIIEEKNALVKAMDSKEFHVEGFMVIQGLGQNDWFVWKIRAQQFIFDDLK